MREMVKNKKNFKFVLLVISFLLLSLVVFAYYHHFAVKNIFLYSSPCKIEVNYYSFYPLEETPLVDENKEEIEDLWNKTRVVISQAPISYSFVKISQTLADFSFEFYQGNKIQACIYSGLVLNDKNFEETKLILSFNKKYYLSQDLGYIIGSISQISLRVTTLELLNSAEKVTIFCDKFDEAQTYKEHEVTKDEREKLIGALKETKTSPLFGGPETILSGKAPPYPFYSIDIKKDNLAVNISWLEENYDYLRITFEKSGELIIIDETSKTLYQINHELLKACKEILPVDVPKPPDIRYFFLADSAKLTKENMGMKDASISHKEIYCILKTILRKDLDPIEVNDEVPMVIEFEIEGDKEIMTIGSDYVECFGKRINKPHILFYAMHCLR